MLGGGSSPPRGLRIGASGKKLDIQPLICLSDRQVAGARTADGVRCSCTTATPRQRDGNLAATAARHHASVPTNDHDDRAVHIDLDLALHGDELRGRAAVDGLPERDFTGWVGLIAALDALIEPLDE